jgi:hypothetical protein
VPQERPGLPRRRWPTRRASPTSSACRRCRRSGCRWRWRRTRPAEQAAEISPSARRHRRLARTARHAYAYLFFTARKPRDRAFEDRQTQVRDYYNYAVQQAITGLFRRYQARAATCP